MSAVRRVKLLSTCHFAELESTMYNRRRRAQPQLTSSPSDADAIVRNSRYAELDGGTFYRGLVN